MFANTPRIFSFILSLFFVMSCLNLHASDIDSKQAMPLIQASADVNDGILRLALTAPKHLTIQESYRTFSTNEGRGLESDFIFTNTTSENPKMITFSIFVKNTDDGIHCVINEIQIFEEKGWFSDSFSRQESSQAIQIQNNFVNMAVDPEMRTARNVFENSVIIRFSLFP